jgi:predicted amino acid racemase
MLAQRMLESNPKLIDAAVELHQLGALPANSFLFDLDVVAENARLQANEAKRLGLTTYLMTKQIARNPLVTKTALANGIDKTVAVDVQCARMLARYGIPIGHIGQINQIPKHQIDWVIAQHPDVITVYSLQAAEWVSAAAAKIGRLQHVLVRVWDEGDVFFDGQEGGFRAEEFVEAVRAIDALPNLVVVGATSFPSMEYSFDAARFPVQPLPNFATVRNALERARAELGLALPELNAPGNTSVATMQIMKDAGATQVEPGHGLCGTTIPQMMLGSDHERPAYLYVSEISHHFRDYAYAFGGGIWALLGPLFKQWPWTAFVGTDPESARNNPVDYAHIDQVMDYVLPLKPADRCRIGDTVAFPVYAQAQMSRAYTVAVSGVQAGQPTIEGIFDHAATMLDEHLVPLPVDLARERIDHAIDRLSSNWQHDSGRKTQD